MIRNTLVWVVIGALIGHVTARPTESAIGYLYERYCQGEKHFSVGKKLRLAGLNTRSVQLHQQANFAFDRAIKCGMGIAKTYRAQAYCHEGWGQSVDTRYGLAMIRDAYRRDPRVSPEFLLDPDFCPIKNHKG